MTTVSNEKYERVREMIRSGDVALLRNGGAIGATSQAPWTHAAVCVWVGRVLMLAEVREFHGGRLVTLSSQVKDSPGRWDIFEPTCPLAVALQAAELITKQAGHPYGWRSVARALALRLSLLRVAAHFATELYERTAADAPDWLLDADRWLNPDTSDTTAPSEWDEPKHCSQTVAWAFRLAAAGDSRTSRGKWDLVPHKHDRYVEPADLGTSAALRLKLRAIQP